MARKTSKAHTDASPASSAAGGAAGARRAVSPQKTYTVIRDTRERQGHGWVFRKTTSCAGTVVRKLDAGDYTIEGYEHVVTVDRKGSCSEFAGNLTQPRFERELARMADYELPVILLEFELEEFLRWPEGSEIPKAKRVHMRMTGRSLLARLWKLQLKYPHVHIVFAGLCGKEVVASLFKRVLESRR